MGKKYSRLNKLLRGLIDIIILDTDRLTRPEMMKKAGYRVSKKSKNPDWKYNASWKRIHQNPRFIEGLEERRAEIYEEEKIKLVCDLERVILEERRLAFANFCELVDKDGYLKCLPTELTEDQQRAIQSLDIEESRDRNTGEVIFKRYKPKLWDKGKALERLGKLMGGYPGGKKQPQVIEQPSVEAAAADVKSVLKAIFGEAAAAPRGLAADTEEFEDDSE